MITTADIERLGMHVLTANGTEIETIPAAPPQTEPARVPSKPFVPPKPDEAPPRRPNESPDEDLETCRGMQTLQLPARANLSPWK
jgi:hypothetical protein